MRLVRLRALLLSTVLLAVLTACGSSEEPSGDSGSAGSGGGESSGSPSAEASPAEEPSPSGSPSTAATGSEVEVKDLGFAFTAPEGWTTIDPDVLQKSPRGSEVVTDLAKRMGMTEEELLSTLSQQAEVMVISNEPVRGFAPNINVVKVDQDIGNVTEETLRRDFTSLGATVENVAEIETELGPATTVTYQMAPGGTQMHGHGVFFEHDGGSVTVTVTSLAKAETKRVGATIVESLRPL